MDAKTLLWYGVLASLTAAYLVTLAGVRSARQHDVAYHSRLMIRACTIVGIWLVAYVLKQLVFGRERFGGDETAYWTLYVPVFTLHMLLAVTTIAIGAYNLHVGITRLRHGSVGAMAAGMTRHRRLGQALVWCFTGTMLTAYAVYLLLFVWYSPAE